MVVYEVNMKVNAEIYDQFKAWLVAHVKKMMQFDGFIEAKILQEHSDDSTKKKITCYYLLDSQQNLTSYLNHYALSMRQDASNKFGNQFTVMKRTLEVTNIISSNILA